VLLKKAEEKSRSLVAKAGPAAEVEGSGSIAEADNPEKAMIWPGAATAVWMRGALRPITF
jgi:hypothetical protein